MDILLTGDSFTQGLCVNYPGTAQGYLVQQAKLSAISVGIGGNGPLSALGALKEYFNVIKPRAVFWLYYENDIESRLHPGFVGEIEDELESEILVKYLRDDEFSQDLVKKNDIIQKSMHAYWMTKYNDKKEAVEKEDFLSRVSIDLVKCLKLETIRAKLNPLVLRFGFSTLRAKIEQRAPASPNYDFFLEALQMGAAYAKSRDAKFTFVYVASYWDLSLAKHQLHDQIVNDVRSIGIDVVDLTELMKPEDIYRYFPNKGLGHHYNEKGYARLGMAIEESFKRSGTLPFRR